MAVTSTGGVGTRFTITLPVTQTSTAALADYEAMPVSG